MNIRPFGFHEHLNLFRCSSNSNEFKLPFAVFSSLNTGGQAVFLPPSASHSACPAGLKWTRTTDLALIRRALYPAEL